jgi:hypothetical protein
MTFDASEHPRSTDGTFTEKTGATPEVNLAANRLRGGKNGIFWRENISPDEYDDIAVGVSGFIEDNPDLLSKSKVRVIPAAKLPYEHYEHDTDNRDAEYPLVKFLLCYTDGYGEDRKLAVDYYDTQGDLEREGGIAINDALYDAVYEARVGSQHPADEFFDMHSGVYREFGSVSRATAYYDRARQVHQSAEAFFGEDQLEELMGSN